MSYQLDAWLEITALTIRVTENETAQVYLEFKEDEVHALLDQRIIDPEDLCTRDELLEKEIIDELFLYAKDNQQTNVLTFVSSLKQRWSGVFSYIEDLRVMFVSSLTSNWKVKI